MFRSIFNCSVLFLIFVSFVVDHSKYTFAATSDQQQIVDALFENYREDLMPEERPLKVKIRMYIRSLEIMEPDYAGSVQRLTATLYLTETWKDHRLEHTLEKPLVIPRTKEIWNPDTFIANEINGAPIERSSGDYFISVASDGTVVRSTRLNQQFHCPSNYFFYPYHRTKCSIILESYGHTTDELIYSFDDKKGATIALHAEASPLGYSIEKFEKKETIMSLSSGKYSNAKISLIFRQTQSHRNILEMFFAPSLFFLISTVAFLLPQWSTTGFQIVVACFSVFMMTTCITYANFNLARFSIVHTWISGLGFLIVLEGIAIFCLIYFGQTYYVPQQTTKPGEASEPQESGSDNPNLMNYQDDIQGDQFGLLTSIPVGATPKERLLIMIRLGLFIGFLAIFCILFLYVVIAINSQG